MIELLSLSVAVSKKVLLFSLAMAVIDAAVKAFPSTDAVVLLFPDGVLMISEGFLHEEASRVVAIAAVKSVAFILLILCRKNEISSLAKNQQIS